MGRLLTRIVSHSCPVWRRLLEAPFADQPSQESRELRSVLALWIDVGAKVSAAPPEVKHPKLADRSGSSTTLEMKVAISAPPRLSSISGPRERVSAQVPPSVLIAKC